MAEVTNQDTPADGTGGGGLSEPNEGCRGVELRGMVVDVVRSGGDVKIGGIGDLLDLRTEGSGGDRV